MKEMIEQELLPQVEEIKQTSKWKSYEYRKDSGFDTLEKIPEHWTTRRLGLVCQINPSKGEIQSLAKSTKVSFLPMELIGDDGSLTLSETREIEQVSNGYTYFRNGDVIVAKITPCFENGKGALCKDLVNSVGFGTTELHVLRPNKQLLAPFLLHITRSPMFRMLGTASMTGSAGQQRVTSDFIKDFLIALPPLAEQQAIAAFLDRETTKINALISKRERMIELLQERRAAVINQAVTKGLNPAVKMKDSSVEWLGEIPEHWETKKLKYLAKFLGGGTPSKANIDYWNGEIPWVSPKDMKADIINDTEDHITLYALKESTTNIIQPGSVLVVVRSGILRHSIPVAINRVQVTINQDIKAILPCNSLLPEYLSATINSHQEVLLVEWRKLGATVESLEYELLINTRISVPPLKEQRAIVEFIQSKTAPIDKLITGIQQSIQKLKEYKVALISAAVTGKIDVRGEVDAMNAESAENVAD